MLGIDSYNNKHILIKYGNLVEMLVFTVTKSLFIQGSQLQHVSRNTLHVSWSGAHSVLNSERGELSSAQGFG